MKNFPGDISNEELEKRLNDIGPYAEAINSDHFATVVRKYDIVCLRALWAFSKGNISNAEFISNLERLFANYGEVVYRDVTVLEL